MVTYEQLKSGYILQKEDKLVLHGIYYQVKNNGLNYLYTPSSGNTKVYDILGMSKTERATFNKKFSPLCCEDALGAFPEFSDLKALTDLVIALYEIPEYKEGDWVTILPRVSSGYTGVIYSDGMTAYSGDTCQVKSCHLRDVTPKNNDIDSGDPHSYILNTVGYYWTSQMIRKATEEEIQKAKSEQVKSFAESDSMSGPIDKLKKEINDFTAKLKSRDSVMPDIPYPTWWGDKPSDTEIRLPKNEEETPHIKL